MNPYTLSASVTALATALAAELDDSALSMAAALFTQLGDTLATIAAQRALCAGQLSADNGNTGG